MQKTTNFNLNQWDAADPIRREDFNADNAALDAALAKAGNCSIECGTYTGTGTYGEANPNTLTFGIQPKIVFIFAVSQYGAMANTAYNGGAMGTSNMMFYYGGNRVRTYYSGSGEGSIYYTLSDNTLTWYSSQDDSVQLNNNTVYGYVAIG